MKKVILLISIVSSSQFVDAQLGKVNLPQVIPPSPEATAIAKGGQLSVGMFTGAPSASIPLYEIKLRNLSIPISLNYSSNGFKVDEIPGRTGLGWNLSMGGSVNRTVHGKPDEGTSWLPYPTGSPFPTEAQLYDYYQALVSDATKDNERDEFNVTAPGLSAKFILDNNGQPIFIPHCNLKVEILGGNSETNPYSVFIITNTDGIVYRFGGTTATETTITHNQIGQTISRQQIRTAFFLKSIRLPEGDSITYTYSPLRFETYPGISQGVRRGSEANLEVHCLCHDLVKCPGPAVIPGSFHESVSEVMYSSAYLTDIFGPNSLRVHLEYENRPDGSDDKRMISINIQTPFVARLFKLIYSDPSTIGNSGGNGNYATAGNYNKRFFLSEVQIIKRQQGSIPADTVKYTLDYDDINNLPPRLSYSQDLLGFYNGAYNAYFLPIIDGQSQNWGQYATADRSFRGAYAVKGMLTKVTYPTGGYDQFVYEPNTISKLITAPGENSVMVTKSTTGSGNSSPSTPTGTWITVDYYTDTLLALQNQNATITINTFANPGCSSCNQAPSNTVDWVWVKLINVTTNTEDWTEVMRLDTSVSFQLPLYANNVYKLKLIVKGLPNAAYTEIRYNRAGSGYSGGSTYANVEAGGVRVKQVISYDPVSNSSNNKYYTYASRAAPITSSGKSLFFPNSLEASDYREACIHGGNGTCFNPPLGEHLTCQVEVLASNSAMPVYLFDNNHIGYEYVIVSDDAGNVNGNTEHKFDVNTFNNRTVVMGYENTGVATNTVITTTGIELYSKVYNAAGTLIKEVYNYNHTHTGYLTQFSNFSVRKRYGDESFANNPPDRLHPYDVTQYDYQSYWVQLDSTITFDYDLYSTYKNKVTNYYSSAVNTLPAKTETVNSKGEITSTEFTYPTDLSGSSPYNTMISRNVITPVVEEIDKNGTSELARVKTFYRNISGSLFRPDSIQRSFKGGSLMTEATFDLYDSKGNLEQMTPRSGVVTSYIWGYNQLYPVAQIIGRGYNDAITTSGINVNNLSGIPDDGSGQSELDLLRSLTNTSVTTYLYRPYTGVSIQTDPRGKYTYYYYDNVGRLSLVKDNDGKVLKKFCYTYAGRTEYCSAGCSNTAADWQNTETSLRCQFDSIGNNTGYQEQEQKDMNNCSPTYGQIRWITGSYNTGACPLYSGTVTLNSINYVAAEGYLSVFVNNYTGEVYSFAVPTASGTQSLGSIPAANYSVFIYKPEGSTLSMVFGACSQTVTATSATFNNVTISSSCHTITIDAL
jgi:hypothetical protein